MFLSEKYCIHIPFISELLLKLLFYHYLFFGSSSPFMASSFRHRG